MKTSLRERIKAYFKRNPDVWFNGTDLERLALENGYKASNSSRRLRELENEGVLIREMRKGKGVASVWYRLSPLKYKTIEFYVDEQYEERQKELRDEKLLEALPPLSKDVFKL